MLEAFSSLRELQPRHLQGTGLKALQTLAYNVTGHDRLWMLSLRYSVGSKASEL
jgi:hypothetical protein